jgi:adenine-specific DNA-methyltransferase
MGQIGSPIRATRAIQLPLLVPGSASRADVDEPKGVVYTKRWVVELLLDLAGYTADRNLVDVVAVEPAAGNGAFLGPIVERLVDSCRRECKPLTACLGSLVAYELDETSAQRAHEFVVECLLGHNVARPMAEKLASSWVRTGDYLFDAHTIAADFVIGNPPYVRLEDIPEATAQFYRDAYPTMVGRADLYIAFFEAALRQLNEGGVCAFICADRWMRNQYGAQLRELVTSAYAVDVVIEMHNADAFQDEVDAYPAITVIRRGKQASALVASAGEDASELPTGKLSGALQEMTCGKAVNLPKSIRVAKVENWFKGNAPWPCHSPDQMALLRRIEEYFPPLEASTKVGIGVATGNDDLFITRDSHLVEPSRLLKLALVKDIAQGTLDWSGHYLIDPWNCDGLVDLHKFPRLQSYFEAHASALKKRHTAVKNVQGWYRTIDRVTHSLTDKPKLYIADIKNSLEPVLDCGGTYPHHNLYFIASDHWDLEVLGGLLLSAIGLFFVESYGVRMRGGYFRFQAQYLRRIRIPFPDALTKGQMKELREAFRARDKQRATELTLPIYGIEADEMERALGH